MGKTAKHWPRKIELPDGSIVVATSGSHAQRLRTMAWIDLRKSRKAQKAKSASPKVQPVKPPEATDFERHMEMRRKVNFERALRNPNENRVWERLELLGGWERQVVWRGRIFDFFHAAKGVAIEVDGLEHNEQYDAERDREAGAAAGIIVLRVRNHSDADLDDAIAVWRQCGLWQRRR
jgi:very-short-patch-repair endonuclease